MKALKASLTALFALLSFSVFAQPSIGASVGITKHFGEYFIDLTPTARVSAHCLIRFKDKLVGKYGAAYTFTAKNVSTYRIEPRYYGIAQPMDAKYTFKLHGPSIFAQTRYYVVGDYYSAINLYIPFDVGLHLLFADGRFEKINPSIYDMPDWYDGPQKDFLLGYSIGAGCGAEFQVGVPYIFLESQFVFPVNSVNGQYVEPKVPMHIVFDVGMRFPLDGSYKSRYRRRRR